MHYGFVCPVLNTFILIKIKCSTSIVPQDLMKPNSSHLGQNLSGKGDEAPAVSTMRANARDPELLAEKLPLTGQEISHALRANDLL